MKYFTIIVITTMIFCQDQFYFSYETIPFGKNIEDVLKIVEGASVKQEDNIEINSVRYYERIEHYFSGGLYSIAGLGANFNSTVSQKYILTDENWDKISQIDLYFSRDFIYNGPYQLFLLRKKIKPPKGNYKNIFNGMEQGITKILGVSPTVFSSNYKSMEVMYYLGTNAYVDSRVAIWEMKEVIVFLLVPDITLTSGLVEILYVSRNGWNYYLESCNSYEADKKAKQEKEGKKSLDVF